MSNKYLFFKKCCALVKLARINQPIGIFLLLWPTLWGLWCANKGTPDFSILIIFIIGTVCMRSAGCIINDYVDCDIDCLVNRTKNRPLSVGLVTKKDALIVLLILLIISAVIMLVLFNMMIVYLSLIALLLSIMYPYSKRCICIPQVMLAILFSWPILMGFIMINHAFNKVTWLLFLINFFWVVIYDTQYAMVDREYDKCIGIKSSAILFGSAEKLFIGFLQFCMICLLWILGRLEQFPVIFYVFAIKGVIILFIWQQVLIYKRKELGCFQAFLINNYVGMSIFIGIALSFY